MTPLQELTAVAAVANGGYLVTPHLIDRLTDGAGNTVYQYKTDVKRQVISTAAADTVSAILEEGVSGTGASRNAYAAGYRIAAKTGTSEKLDKADAVGGFSLRIGSCVGFAPYDKTEIAVIIVVDEPTTAHYGATVAAPYISALMKKVLPYLGYEAVYTEKEKEQREVTVGQYVGMSVGQAKRELAALGITVDTGGVENSAIVTGQMPAASTVLNASLGRVILYTDKAAPTVATVPNLQGMDPVSANSALLSAGLNIRIAGTQNTPDSGNIYPKAVSQSIPAGTAVERGTVITVKFLYDDQE